MQFIDMAFLGLISDWTAFGAALLATVIFGLIGMALMVIGFKLFDFMTPHISLEKELAENKNIAVAIVVASVIIGTALIVAAAMS